MRLQRHGRHGHPLRLKDAGGYGVCLVGCDPVPERFEAGYPGPGCGQVYTSELVRQARDAPAGSVQPGGTPIIHSTNDGAVIGLQGGRFARPVKPQTQPSK